jgi:hypothetical protein
VSDGAESSPLKATDGFSEGNPVALVGIVLCSSLQRIDGGAPRPVKAGVIARRPRRRHRFKKRVCDVPEDGVRMLHWKQTFT